MQSKMILKDDIDWNCIDKSSQFWFRYIIAKKVISFTFLKLNLNLMEQILKSIFLFCHYKCKLIDRDLRFFLILIFLSSAISLYDGNITCSNGACINDSKDLYSFTCTGNGACSCGNALYCFCKGNNGDCNCHYIWMKSILSLIFLWVK